MTAIDVTQTSVRYAGGTPLEFAPLTVAAGQAVALLGPSGSGKTTLLRLLAGVLLPASGRVTVLDTDWATLTERQRRAQRLAHIGQVFQQFGLLPHLSVHENIVLPFLLDPRAACGSTERDRAADLAQSTGIAPLLARKPERLSHGERQRVALCRALVTRPSLVLADEPTGNLDARTARVAVKLMREQTGAHEATLVMVTHDRSITDGFDRVIDLRSDNA